METAKVNTGYWPVTCWPVQPGYTQIELTVSALDGEVFRAREVGSSHPVPLSSVTGVVRELTDVPGPFGGREPSSVYYWRPVESSSLREDK